jgi:molecular chaperone GrpE
MNNNNLNPEDIQNESGGDSFEQQSGADAEENPTEESELTLEEQLELAIQEKDKNYDRWVRSVAELENFRKRANKEKDSSRQMALAGLVRNLLPAFDNLQRTVEASENNTNVADLLQGVQMVQKQLVDSLSEHAIKKIEAIGEEFDPNLHEAVQQFPSDEYAEMVVMKELESGFTLGDLVIRPSKVIVSSGPAEQQSEA